VQLAIFRPDDAIDFSETYFQKLKSHQHILGKDYFTICTTQHGRRSLVYCIKDALSNFSENEEITVIDFQQLLLMICPDFPRHIIYEGMK
jgi:hypothetical protein